MYTDQMQSLLESTIKSHDEIAAMIIYSSNGTILAHSYPDRIGKNLTEADTVYGTHTEEARQAVANGKIFQCSAYSAAMGQIWKCSSRRL